MVFIPDYRYFEDVLHNLRPERLPLYEHIISPRIMETILQVQFADLINGSNSDRREYFHQYCRFFQEMTYDVVSFEMCITDALPGHGAICGGKRGPIQTRSDFNAYPWTEIPELYWKNAADKFDTLVSCIPAGMKVIGGVGNGIFEISEDLVGLEYLPFMQVDDPDLYKDLFKQIGDIMIAIWSKFLQTYSEYFIGCRIGDDLGFRSSLLTNPSTFKDNILPQYKRIIRLIHSFNKPFLWHSCGCIFEIMENMITAGIDAKHSNEDAIAPFCRWIDDYSERIGLLGGFDMDFLCQKNPDEILQDVVQLGQQYRRKARGYALGSGNSIPDYIPVENYLAMIRGAQAIRTHEKV